VHAKTPSFITDIPLKVNQDQERTLLVRLDTARQLYNACLGEALRRLDVMRQSVEYKQAKKLPRTANGKTNPERVARFKAARELFLYSEYAISRHVTAIRNSWLGEHIDSNTAQKISKRAFQATERYCFGLGGRPRFKAKTQFDSVEGKTNKQGIRWLNGSVVWSGLELQAIINEKDLVLMHGLQSPIKYVRIIRRKFGERNRFFAQLVCEGFPYSKPANYSGNGVVGLDIGPSTIAIVSEQAAELKTFCDKLVKRKQYIRRLQRKMDRSRRATNLDNYNENGTTKQGKRLWVRSNRYQKVRAQKSESERKQAAHRKSLHGAMVNQIIRQGDSIKLEKLSYKAFQKMFGRSIAFRAPGMFVEILRRKAANAGVEIHEFDPRPTRLSQTCVCGTIEKKPLSQRWHDCACGVLVQRDIFSAWLACQVEDGRLNAGLVLRNWPDAENRLRMALGVKQLASGQVRPAQVLVPLSESSVLIELYMDEALMGQGDGINPL